MSPAPAYAANIPRFLVSRVLYNFMLFLPVWVIFVQRKHGLDLVQITLLDSAFWLTMAITEVPTGAVADTIGRKQSYAIGLALSAAGSLLFAAADNYPLLLFANSLWALALTFISGADLAFLYDSLRVLGREGEYRRFRSLVATIDIVSAGLSAVLGGLMFAWQPESPFIVYALLLLAALAIVATFREPPGEPDPDGGPKPGYVQILREAGLALRESPVLRHVLAYSNLLPMASAAIGVTLIQPHAVAIGLPVESLGILLLGYNVARVLGSGSAPRLARRLGDWRLLHSAPLMLTAGVIGIGTLPGLGGILVFAIAVFGAALARPTIETIMMAETPGRVRATILSVDSLIFRLLLAGLGPFAGLVAEAYSLPLAFVLMGAGAGLLLALNLWLWGRLRAA